MAQPGLLLFAVEGVLVDNEPLRALAWSTTLAEHGVKLRREQCQARFAGRSDATARASIENEIGRALPATFAPALRRRLETIYARELRAVPDVAGTLRRLRLPICALSGAARDLARHALETARLWDAIRPNLFTADMVAREPPAADLAQLAAAEMGVPVGRCMLVDATANGVRGGRAAGMKVFGFTDDPAHQERLARAGADLVVERMSELPPLVRARAA